MQSSVGDSPLGSGPHKTFETVTFDQPVELAKLGVRGPVHFKVEIDLTMLGSNTAERWAAPSTSACSAAAPSASTTCPSQGATR
jgi:hypothetical protein